MFNSLKARFIVSTVLLLVATVTILTILFTNNAVAQIEEILVSDAIKNIEFTKNYIYAQYDNIELFKKELLEAKRRELKSSMDIVMVNVQKAYMAFETGMYTEEQAKSKVLEEMKTLVYDDGKGCFWVQEWTEGVPRMIVSAENPELNGKRLENLTFKSVIPDNENIFVHANTMVSNNGEGQFKYYWYQDDKQLLKEAYVKGFEEWQWVIGTSFDVENLFNEADSLIDFSIDELNKINQSSISKEGYFFIFDSDANMIVHPSMKGMNVKNIISQTTGNPLVSDLMGAADFEDTYLKYLWDHPEDRGNYSYTKHGYVTYFEPFDWYIVSTFYVEEAAERVHQILIYVTSTTIILLLLGAGISYWTGTSATRPLNTLVEALETIDFDGKDNHIDIKGTSEINILTSSVNNMMDSIKLSREDILDTHSKLQSIMDSATKLAIVTTDTEGIIMSFNIGAEIMLGYKEEEVVGQVSPLIFHLKEEINERSEELSAIYKREITGFQIIAVAASEMGYEEREWTFVKQDGSRMIGNLIVTNIIDQEGQLKGYLGMVSDITNKKETEEKLKKRTEELKSAVKNLITHEEHLEDMVRENTSVRRVLRNHTRNSKSTDRI